jgi:predicted dehydrogenase
MNATSPKVLRVGIIGLGEVAQSVHLPTLALLSHLYTVTAIHDISPSAVEHCARKFHIQTRYSSCEELCASPDVDVVFILTSDEFHSEQAVVALQHHKHVLVEKPVSMSIAGAQRILAAERLSRGKVFVAYMRRYSGALGTMLEEMAAVKEIKFARIRDIIGPNAAFVGQSGTFPQQFTDFPPAAAETRERVAAQLLREVFPDHAHITPAMVRTCRFLGGLGSHDLSIMREILGMPLRCTGVSVHPPFFTATFEYDGYAVSYETGIDAVPRFDAHVQIYGSDRTIKLEYDTPYIKGLPVKVTVDEAAKSGGYQRREIISTYEDAYTSELRELHECLVAGKAIKTTVEDATKDLEIFQMILRQAFPVVV